MRLGAIVLAGGSGERFGAPKYAVEFAGEKLIDRAVRLVTQSCSPVVVALPAGAGWRPPDQVEVVLGGASRGDSLSVGVRALSDRCEIAVIHDVVRPLANQEQLDRVVEAVRAGADVATCGWAPPDTVKLYEPDGSVTHLGRESVRLVHGPVAVRLEALIEAERVVGHLGVEETVVVEQIGGTVAIVEGDIWSHHIVTPRDVALAEAIAATESGNSRELRVPEDPR